MSIDLSWDAPGTGPWQQDSAHNPVSQSRLMQQIYPSGFNCGFEETFADYGLLLDRLAMGVVNGFTYHQPAVDDYVAGVHFRVLDGFDVTNPTIGERPESIVGRIRAALNIDHDLSPRRADEFAAELRAATPEEDRETFDDLLREARLMDRLRDERGLYSDIPSIEHGDVLVLE